MKPIIMVGGTLGQTLIGTRNSLPYQAWADLELVGLGSLRTMELQGQGTTPKPPHGVPLSPGPWVPGYMHELRSYLGTHPRLNEYSVETYSYDWRLPIGQTGSHLADLVETRAAVDGPVTIIAHSQGGLLARRAWRDLFDDGQSTAIRRIITIGTPHYGSYAPISVMCGIDPLVDLIAQGVGKVQWAALRALDYPYLVGAVPYTREEIGKIVATWMSYYQLMPFINCPFIEDHLLPELYSAAAWPGSVEISAGMLNHAAGIWQAGMTSAPSIPPGSVMTCYIGRGVETTAYLRVSVGPWSVAYHVEHPPRTTDGDGRVIVERASTPGAKRIMLLGEHSELINHPFLRSTLIDEILEERSVAPPTIDPVPPVPYRGYDPTFPLEPLATIPQDVTPAVPQVCPPGGCHC